MPIFGRTAAQTPRLVLGNLAAPRTAGYSLRAANVPKSTVSGADQTDSGEGAGLPQNEAKAQCDSEVFLEQPPVVPNLPARHTSVIGRLWSALHRALEERLGVRLLDRTTRSVAPTEAGNQLISRLRPALGDVESVLSELVGTRDRPTGPSTATRHSAVDNNGARAQAGGILPSVPRRRS
jgi:hypothetical protein